MRTGLSRQQTPEEAELERRRLELSALRATLAAREQSLAELRAQLHSFEGRYIRQVGVLYKQLDEWELKIAELDSPLLAEVPESLASDDAAPRDFELAADPRDAEAPIDLRALFRELARRIHPDFAADTADAAHRNRLMAQANDAFRRKDSAVLQRMLNGHDASGTHADTADKLANVIAQLKRVEADILQVDAVAKALTRSEMAELQQRTILAAEKGRDLLAEMAARVKGNIGMAMRRYELDLERRKRKQPAFDPTSLLSAEAPPPPSPADSNG